MISALDLQIRVNWARGGGGDKKKKVGENGVGMWVVGWVCGWWGKGKGGNGRGPACMLENTRLCLWSVPFCQMARMEKRNQQSKTKGFNNMEGGGW